jgi:hypothetical protein
MDRPGSLPARRHVDPSGRFPRADPVQPGGRASRRRRTPHPAPRPSTARTKRPAAGCSTTTRADAAGLAPIPAPPSRRPALTTSSLGSASWGSPPTRPGSLVSPRGRRCARRVPSSRSEPPPWSRPPVMSRSSPAAVGGVAGHPRYDPAAMSRGAYRLRAPRSSGPSARQRTPAIATPDRPADAPPSRLGGPPGTLCSASASPRRSSVRRGGQAVGGCCRPRKPGNPADRYA